MKGWIFATLAFLITPAIGAEFTDADGGQAIIAAFRAHSAFDSQLIDYPSARFRNTVAHYFIRSDNKKAYFLCGEVNSKNGLGGYSGWVPFLVSGDGTVELPVNGIAPFVSEICAPDAINPTVIDHVRPDYSQLLYQSMTPEKFAEQLGLVSKK
jgi:hypothetical protein